MYDTLSAFAQTWGMILFIVLFGGATAYALWPRNQSKFDEAARVPLTDDERPAREEAVSGEKERNHG